MRLTNALWVDNRLKIDLRSDLVVWRHEEHHALEQKAEVERLVTLSSAGFHLEQRT